MSARRPAPPTSSGPLTARLEGGELDLVATAREVCRRYRIEFPDEEERYGEAGVAWCVHDNQHLLSWAALAVEYGFDMDAQLAWLADVLRHRDFPVDRLARDLEIASEVVESPALAQRLRDGAGFVRGL